MKTDGIYVTFNSHDIDIIRHHKGNDQSASRKMIHKLERQGVVEKVDHDKATTYRTTLDNFLFYFTLAYNAANKEYYIRKYFSELYPTININHNNSYSLNNDMKKV